MDESYLQRFGGIGRLYGHAGLACFAQSHVMVIGLGGVGSWMAEALVRSGIGAITLMDLDDICVTNVNRQCHAVQSTLGQPKTQAMADRLLAINPQCRVTVIDDFLDTTNVSTYITPELDYVLDAIDSVRPKIALIVHCKHHKIPLLVAGGAGGKTDPLQLKLADLSKTIQDPLLAKVRAELRQHHGFSRDVRRKFGVDCVFSTEALRFPDGQGGVCHTKSQSVGELNMNCATGFGSITHMTATLGFIGVSRVLQKLLQRSSLS